MFREPPADDFRQAYILIKDDLAVREAFSAGSIPGHCPQSGAPGRDRGRRELKSGNSSE